MLSSASLGRVLSVQSSVVHGVVGNKAAIFPLQLHGFDVDPINSVQLSNHTGYKHFKGQKLSGAELDDLFEGLNANDLLSQCTHLLTGYLGSATFVRSLAAHVQKLRSKQPSLRYVCDPVMGDAGRLYVPQEFVQLYHDLLVPLADLLTPNQTEAEMLTSSSIQTLDDAVQVCDKLHAMGPRQVVITSFHVNSVADLAPRAADVAYAKTNTVVDSRLDSFENDTEAVADELFVLCSERDVNGETKRKMFSVRKLPGYYTGTGDLMAALLLAFSQTQTLFSAVQNTLAAVHSVLLRMQRDSESTKLRELSLIQERRALLEPWNAGAAVCQAVRCFDLIQADQYWKLEVSPMTWNQCE